MKKKLKRRWIILQSTLCQGTIPGWFGGNDRPVVHRSQKAAQLEMLEEHHILLGQQIEEFKKGEREFEEIDIDLRDWVEPCSIDSKGVINIQSGEIYNPKTYVR